MASTPTQDLQDEFLNTVRKSQETVIDAIKTWVETVQSITPKVPSVQVPGADKLPKPEERRGQRLRLRRAAARQPAQVRRRGPQGDDLADAGHRGQQVSHRPAARRRGPFCRTSRTSTRQRRTPALPRTMFSV